MEGLRRRHLQCHGTLRHCGSPLLCAGEGRDVLPVLAEPGLPRHTATLIEIDPRLAERARRTATELGLDGVEVVVADAGTLETYEALPRADVLLVCGVFGNISPDDVRRTVAALPLLVVAGGTVVWTRGTEDMDRTPQIREWFASSGFAEVGFRKTPDRAFAGGALLH